MCIMPHCDALWRGEKHNFAIAREAELVNVWDGDKKLLLILQHEKKTARFLIPFLSFLTQSTNKFLAIP